MRSNPFVFAAVAFVVTVVLFWPATGHEFITMDDPIYVYENPHVLGGLTGENIAWAFSTTHGSIVAPLTWVSYMLDVEREGTDARGFHRTNVVLHGLNATLLFLLLWRATGNTIASLLVALLFALHPLRVESVAWITERKDVLSTAFLLGAMHAYLNYAKAPTPKRMLAVAGLMLLGLLSKPMVVVLPLLLLAFDHWPLRREIALRARIIEKWPLFALSAGFALLTVFAHGRDGSGPAQEGLISIDRLLRVPVAYGFQVQKWIWPSDLVALYPDTATVPALQVIAGLVVLVALIGVAWMLRRRVPAVTAGVAWFVLGLLPVTGVVTVGIAHLADRFGYVPGIGLAIALVFGVAHAVRGNESRQKIAVALGAIAVITAAANVRPVLAKWQDSETLFRHAIETTGGNAYAYTYLGGYLAMRGEAQEATQLLRRAVELDPGLVDAHANLSQLLSAQQELGAAITHARRAVELAPDHMPSQMALGSALLRANRPEEAERAFKRAIELRPSAWEPHYNLGQLYMVVGNLRRAQSEMQEALRLSPGNPRILARLQELRGN